MNDLITVYMPTFCRLERAKRAVQSVLNSDYQNIQLIVVDDDPKESFLNYIDAIKDSRLILKKNIFTKGAPGARNTALKFSEGKYITGLDDDDLFKPCRLSTFIKNKEYLEEFAALYTGYLWKTYRIKKTSIAIEWYPVVDLIGNKAGNQIFTYTDRLKEISGFDESMPAWQDLETWYRLSLAYGSLKGIQAHNYIFSNSYATDRISTDVTKVYAAYDKFCNKYNLDEHTKNALRCNLYNYQDAIKNTQYREILSDRYYIGSSKIFKIIARKVILC